jgi:hypothetical protein
MGTRAVAQTGMLEASDHLQPQGGHKLVNERVAQLPAVNHISHNSQVNLIFFWTIYFDQILKSSISKTGS